MNDILGDRMKEYEAASERRLMPMLPTFARVDGRAFSSFTRDMERPYDTRMSEAMQKTALALAKETNACMVYTQSDEITLAWYSSDRKSQIWFDGRHSKMTSQIAALATLYFNQWVTVVLPEYVGRMPSFDARVWQVPNKAEGANVFLWRELDATKNSISMAAHTVYGPAALVGKNGSEKQEMLWQKGINWNDYPAFFKRGTFIQRFQVARRFTTEEIDALPPKHEAHTNPELTVTRTEWQTVDMPSFRTVTNREQVVFDGMQPATVNPSPPSPLLSFSPRTTMTRAELDKLPPEEKRIKIAEGCGWTNCLQGAMPDIAQGLPPSGYVESRIAHRATSPDENDGGRWFWLPDYCNDLNAMHEAESLLGEHQVTEYVTHLRGLPYHRSWQGCFGCHAAAAQRADAFLLTVG